jgi:NTP pyrophosphatase (non-canonical NTP hydrolase)
LENFRVASIDDFHGDFSDIWARDATERNTFDLWLHVVDHASRIARAIRKQNPAAVIDDLADTLVWLMSFIAQCQKLDTNGPESCFRFDDTPSDIIWQKYPAICPGCYDHWLISLLDLREGETPLRKLEFTRDTITTVVETRAKALVAPEACTCVTRMVTLGREPEIAASLRTEFDELRRRHAAVLSARLDFKSTLADLERMLTGIYLNSLHLLTLEHMAVRLLEEVGEASEAIKDLYTFDDSREPYTADLQAVRKWRLLEELADVFAWIFAIAAKIRLVHATQADEYRVAVDPRRSGEKPFHCDVPQIIWCKYGMTKAGANWDRLKCPGCQLAPCGCPRDMRFSWTYGRSTETPGSILRAKDVQQTERNLIFVSYSHKDRAWLERLQVMIKPLARNRIVSVWDDTRIRPGERWRSEIDSALERSRVAVLLVSPDFLASDFIAQNELPPLLEATREHGISIIWVPISASMYKATDIAQYQPAHDPTHPLDSLEKHEQNAALLKICEYIQEAAN